MSCSFSIRAILILQSSRADTLFTLLQVYPYLSDVTAGVFPLTTDRKHCLWHHWLGLKFELYSVKYSENQIFLIIEMVFFVISPSCYYPAWLVKNKRDLDVFAVGWKTIAPHSSLCWLIWKPGDWLSHSSSTASNLLSLSSERRTTAVHSAAKVVQ